MINGDDIPSFLKKDQKADAIESFGKLIGVLGASFRHLVRQGMRRRDAAELLMVLLELQHGHGRDIGE